MLMSEDKAEFMQEDILCHSQMARPCLVLVIPLLSQSNLPLWS